MKTALGLTAAILVVLLLTAVVGSVLAEGRINAAAGDLSADELQLAYPSSVQRVPILYLNFIPSTPPPYP